MTAIQTEDKLEYSFFPVRNFEVSLAVKAPHDAHIALASGASADGPIIEIFLGGWEGQKSAIRLNKEKPDKAIVDTPDIVTADEERTFVVKGNIDGLLEVYLKGAPAPFLSWHNPEPFPITHFGLRTAWGATGEWKVDGVKEVQTPDSSDYTFLPLHGGSLTFDVKAASNAHIALASGPSDEPPLYEIFLGGWDNTKSAIRLNKEKPDKAEAATEQIVTDSEHRRFIVRWNYAGIDVRRGDEEVAILSWNNEDPHVITHYGIRTAWGATGEWTIHDSLAPPLAERPKRQTENEIPDVPEPEPEPAAEETTEEIITTVTTIEGVSWAPGSNGSFADGSLVGGQDHGEDIIVARGNFEGALLPGKLVSSHGVMYVPWGGEEHGLEEYETLIVPADAVSWVPSGGGEIIPNAIPAGTTMEGETLYVGRTQHEDTLTVGKVHPSHGSLYISYGGEELGFENYELLVLN